MEKKACPIGRIHPDHQELTMGEVDDVHHPKDDRQTERHQGEKKTHQESLKDRIEDDHSSNLIGILECWNIGFKAFYCFSPFFSILPIFHHSNIPNPPVWGGDFRLLPSREGVDKVSCGKIVRGASEVQRFASTYACTVVICRFRHRSDISFFSLQMILQKNGNWQMEIPYLHFYQIT
jgi:hypothetical protein